MMNRVYEHIVLYLTLIDLSVIADIASVKDFSLVKLIEEKSLTTSKLLLLLLTLFLSSSSLTLTMSLSSMLLTLLLSTTFLFQLIVSNYSDN